MDLRKKDFIFEDVNKLKGVGTQLSKYLKKKRIEKINVEVLWSSQKRNITFRGYEKA